MRVKRALAVLLAAGASLLAVPVPAAAAGSPNLSLTLAERWQVSQQGIWTPYVATVRNDGPADFAGSVLLTATESSRGPAGIWPQYRAAITVPRGTERSVTIFVLDAPAGYGARLVDTAGHTMVDGVTANGLTTGGYAVGVLSDQPQAAQKIEALRPLAGLSGGGVQAGIKVSRFASAQAFPTNAVFLSGLHAVVIDDFDVSTLSDAQVRALRDFVGLGGNLLAAGGAAWRRTLLPLSDQGLGGLRPQRTEQASLQPLADLAGRTTALTVAAGTGERRAGRVVLGDPSGPPLAVESRYGSGLVLGLAFDPLDQAFGSDDTGIAQLAWNFALDRVLLASASAGNHSAGVTGGFAPPAGPVGVKGPVVRPGFTNVDIYGVLADTPAGQAPPIGLLGGVLVFYVLLAGPLSYIALKAAGRRELLWAAIPAIALLFTGIAYASGSQVHGTRYFDSQVQLLRAGPDGVVEEHGYHGVFAPRRGDFSVGVPANALATTVVSMYGGPPQAALVDTGKTTRVEIRSAAYSSMRTIQTLSVGRAPALPAVGVETHLTAAGGRIRGTIRNTGERPLRNLQLVSGAGQIASLVGELGPRASTSIDAALADPSPSTVPLGGRRPAAGGGEGKADLVLRFAAAQAFTGQPDDLALVGLTDAAPELSIAGRPAEGAGTAALLQPVRLEAADTVHSPRAQLVVSSGTLPWHRDVYDLSLPEGYSKAPLATLANAVTARAQGGTVRGVEAYDWDSGGWAPLTLQPSSATPNQATAALPAGAYRGGLVRLRVDELGGTQGISSSVGLADR